MAVAVRRGPPGLKDALDTLRGCEAALREHGVVRAGIFGSLARGDATPDSDIDVLVQFVGHPKLLELGAVHYELECAFGEPVDVIEPDALLALAGPDALSRVKYGF